MSRAGLVLSATIVVLIVLPLASLACGEEPRNVTQLLDDVCDGFGDEQLAAAERLGDLEAPDAATAIRSRLATEREFHTRIALCFALANQGEKKALDELIESLSRSGHFGSIYLRRATEQDFGWDQTRWRKWYDATTADEFRQFVVRRRQQRPMMEEFGRFAGAYRAATFGELRDIETGDPLSAAELERERKEALASPTAKAWTLYEQALTALQSDGDRAKAASLFGEIASRYPNTYYAEESRELETLLGEMVVEDSLRALRPDVRPIDRQARMDDLIFCLRDVEAYQWMQPGRCSVFGDRSGRLFPRAEPNTAEKLRDLGPDVIPALIEALDDRRPMRAVGYWRNFHPDRVVLRVQDAAIEILEDVLPVYVDEVLDRADVHVRRTTSSYLSTEDPKTRAAVNEAFRRSEFFETKREPAAP